MALQVTRFDPVEHIKTIGDVREYLAAALEEPESSSEGHLRSAIKDAVRALAMMGSAG